MKRVLLFLLIVIQLLLLVSCHSGMEQPDDVFSIRVEDLKKYTIVRADDASADICAEVSSFYRAISDKYGEMSLKTDFYAEGIEDYSIGEYEILIGSTNRTESIEIQKELKSRDYSICLVGKKLLIIGGSDDATINALRAFTEQFLKDTKTDVFFKEEYAVNHRENYSIENLLLDGRAIEKYAIIYPKSNKLNEKALALRLQEVIADATGNVLPVRNDYAASSEEYEILIGKTNRSLAVYSTVQTDSEYCMGSEGNAVYLYGPASTGCMSSVKNIIDQIRIMETNGADHSIVLDGAVKKIQDSDLISAMSYNVYYQVDNGIPDRDQKVIQMVLNHMPDTVGFQEVTPEWLTILRNGLKDYYSCVSGKTSHKVDFAGTEYCAIFYRKDKFTEVESGTKWLSETPNVMSRVEGASLNRIVTFVRLKRISDGSEFVCANTHFEHISHEVGEKQAKILLELLGAYKNIPVYVTGDFNSTPDTRKYQILTSSFLKPTSKIAASSYEVDTIHMYGEASATLDYTFVNYDYVFVQDYRVCDEMIDGNYASDHHPILSKFLIFP